MGEEKTRPSLHLNEFEKWKNMDEDEMITIIRKKESKEPTEKESREERAKTRKKYWRE